MHSHAFQRAIAGLTERRSPGEDSFWTWRELMYRFVERIDPEQLEAVTALAFAEMLEAGFARVGEFHYLHQDKAGVPFADPGELAARVAAAAAETGIALTLLPTFYAHGGFGAAEPGARQRRFVTDVSARAHRGVEPQGGWSPAGRHRRRGAAQSAGRHTRRAADDRRTRRRRPHPYPCCRTDA